MEFVIRLGCNCILLWTLIYLHCAHWLYILFLHLYFNLMFHCMYCNVCSLCIVIIRTNCTKIGYTLVMCTLFLYSLYNLFFLANFLLTFILIGMKLGTSLWATRGSLTEHGTVQIDSSLCLGRQMWKLLHAFTHHLSSLQRTVNIHK